MQTQDWQLYSWWCLSWGTTRCSNQEYAPTPVRFGFTQGGFGIAIYRKHTKQIAFSAELGWAHNDAHDLDRHESDLWGTRTSSDPGLAGQQSTNPVWRPQRPTSKGFGVKRPNIEGLVNKSSYGRACCAAQWPA